MIKEEEQKQMLYALNSALIAFQNINAPMSMQNIKYSNIVVSNIQAVLQSLQDENKDNKKDIK